MLVRGALLLSSLLAMPAGAGVVGGSVEYDHHFSIAVAEANLQVTVQGAIFFTRGRRGVIEPDVTSLLSMRMTGTVGECTVDGIAPASGGMRGRIRGRRLVLHIQEDWGNALLVDLVCPDETTRANMPFVPPAVRHTLRFPLKEGATRRQPFIGGVGTGQYVWTLHVIRR